MSVIILLLLASITVSAIFMGAFLWSIKDGQFDDEFSTSRKILFEEQFQPEDFPSSQAQVKYQQKKN